MPEESAHARQQQSTQFLSQARAGDAGGAAHLSEIVYDELRSLAARYLDQERKNHTLQPTALVHEVYLRLIDRTHLGSGDRECFLAIAAQAMRRVLVDHARKRQAAKRGGADRQRVSLRDLEDEREESVVDLVQLETSLTKLAERNQRIAEVVELRFFGGMSVVEIAERLGVSDRTVKKDWFFARGWLARELGLGSSD